MSEFIKVKGNSIFLDHIVAVGPVQQIVELTDFAELQVYLPYGSKIIVDGTVQEMNNERANLMQAWKKKVTA